MSDGLYSFLVWLHLLLLVVWLGGDIGVFLLGQHFRRRHAYALETRLVLLRLLVALDMGPRSAWALMVPSSLLLLKFGPWWPGLPDWLLWAGVGAGVGWLALIWQAHLRQGTPAAERARAIEGWLRWVLAGFYLALGVRSLLNGGEPLVGFVAWKAILFGLIFVAAILIDVAFRPVGPQLAALIAQGSSDATEVPLRRTMDRTRVFVLMVYALLLLVSFVGVVRPAG
ncbi:MAG: hypothetical protein NZM40_02735 [Sphingomonadaceae bacterium]|uniref:hypothetical protein n=1 Tax=Thermaurantiacus sp. TaxID=2820283 RepID=UPI00298F2148|nr:hypothetical protein [Thermaurantiacus sp.]MCS6986341.1 hypothetical protein [Sphingomonadaceae bacterium]MDW8414397.1 hypothetical protein [Thermaurantiacus sp.]